MSEWEQTTIQLSELSTVFTDGDWIEKKDQSLDGIRLIQTGNVGTGQFKNRQDKARFISPQTFEKLKCTEIVAGDCLISRLPDPVGRACLIPEDLTERMITAVDCSIVRFNKDLIIPKFFIYYSQSRSYLAAVEIFCTGATRKRISRKNLGKIKIPLTSLLEQERIVAVLDEAFEAIDTAIANTEKNLSNTEELFQSVLETMLSPQTTISFGSFEEDWDQMKLGDICTLQRGFDLPKRHRVKGSYELVSSSGVIDTHTDFKVTGPGVTTGRSGSIGKVHFIDSNFWPLNTTLYVKDFHGNNPRFVYRLLQNLKLESFAGGTGVPTLNRNLVHPVVTSIPKTYRNQETIAQIIDNAEASINQLVRSFEIKLLCLEELKQSVLEKAFAGELTDSVLEEAGV